MSLNHQDEDSQVHQPHRYETAETGFLGEIVPEAERWMWHLTAVVFLIVIVIGLSLS